MDFQTFLSKKLDRTLKTEELFDTEILRLARKQHLDQTIMGFQFRGTANLDSMRPRWLSLLEVS